MRVVIPVMSFGKAGGERVISRLSTELVNCGCEVYLVTFENAGEIYYKTSAKIVKCRVSKVKNRIWRFLVNNYSLYKKCKELNPDCVVANFHLTAYMVSFLPRNIKRFYYIQAYEVVFYKSAFRRLAAFLTYKLPLLKITNHKDLLPPELNHIIGIIPPGVDEEVFYRRDCINSKKNIGIIGRKEKHKGTSRIIDALLNWDNKENIVLNVALHLDDYDKLRLTECKVQFNFYEIDNDEQLADFYRLNDLVIATGLVENGAFHYPCAEAISCGCIVISNYAPLYYSNSSLKISKFTDDALVTKLNHYISMSSQDIEDEIKTNYDLLKDYSWPVVGHKMYSILKDAKSIKQL